MNYTETMFIDSKNMIPAVEVAWEELDWHVDAMKLGRGTIEIHKAYEREDMTSYDSGGLKEGLVVGITTTFTLRY